ncbi:MULTISPECIES: Hpt domain-containing protein [unclassified Fibrobacter]|uniref:Hpt domain-containing protein n=1 Tax=unclassified Fibrobacter TaxID=2634177 RepID=UPI000D6CBDF6|nr:MULTISPECIES: Hpt domain-containing protein [unclassified Fibrobacter]PWJ59107.1 Hpt domain-containing protein [Fibrobacter sp. UWR4]PZW62964.1 Hpt domain-containing protein [Fibrobacter sp. UWR1]
MDIKELYAKIGGNYEDVLGRLMKDSLIEKFAFMYLKDTSYETLIAAIDAGNISDSFRAAHSLKGVSANLGFEELRKAASDLTEQLRPQTTPADAAMVEAVKTAQAKVLAGLKEFQGA